MNETLFSRRLWAIFVLFVICCCCCLPAQAKYGGGSGTAEDPYQIWDANHMQAIGADANDWDKHFKLVADIDLSAYTGTQFNAIGYYNSDVDYAAFTGVFDGNGHTISNFTWHSTDKDDVGLFVWLNGGEIKNLGLIDPNVIGENAQWDVGALVGYIGWPDGGTVTNCYVRGGYVSGSRPNVFLGGIGALCGVNEEGTISNCYAMTTVIGMGGDTFSGVGGLCGTNYGGTITGCYSEGSVTGYDDVGGLCGENYEGIIINSYATGTVSGDEFLGGLVGTSNGSLSYCYSSGNVNGSAWNIGGLLGSLQGTSSSVLNCLWDINTSGQTNSNGGLGVTTTQMQDMETLSYNGWAGDTWTIDDGNDYPHLAWENKPGQFIKAPVVELDGSGTANEPWLIQSSEDLQLLDKGSFFWDKCYLLTADLDLTGITINPIGYDRYNSFMGSFDGNDHIISNLYINLPDNDYIGLFGYVGASGEIQDVGLINVSINGYVYTGGLVGLSEGSVSNCSATGSVSGNVYVGGLMGLNYYGNIIDCYANSSADGSGPRVGGLVGGNMYGTISHCHATGDASSGGETWSEVGGLVGFNMDSSVSYSYATGSASGTGDKGLVGGLVGANQRSSLLQCYAAGSVYGGTDTPDLGGLCGGNTLDTISECYATGSVFGGPNSTNVGGLCGANNGTISNCYAFGLVSGGGNSTNIGGLIGENTGNESTINNCYATGPVSGGDYVGGLMGYDRHHWCIYNDCFWDIDTSGTTDGVSNRSPDPNGVTGLTTDKMMQQSTFTGWDFVGETINGPNDIWRLCEDFVSYPRLAWEFPLGDFLCPDGVNFIDYSFFASHWLENNCDASNNCGGTDLDLLGTVDIMDIRIFVDNWLEGVKPPIPPPPGCIAHWKLDDGSGNTAIDSAGTNNGALIGNPTWTTGRVDGALSFDGSAEYVVAAPVAPLAGDNFTALAWIRIDESAGLYNSFLMQNRFGDNYGFYFYISHNRPDVYIFGSSGNANANSTETLNANQWYHVATTNDGSNLKLYVDGQLKDTDYSAGLTGVNENVYIGFDPITSIYYTGLIDDVRIYNRALTEEEIAYLAD